MFYTISKAKSGDCFIILWIFNDLPDVGSPFQLLEVCDQLEALWLARKVLLLSLSVVCPLPPPVLSLLLSSSFGAIQDFTGTQYETFSVLSIVLGCGQLWAVNIYTYYKDK